MSKYKDRYVLAEGYPVSQDMTRKITTLQMIARPDHIGEEDAVILKIPEYLLFDIKMPKYRLVLEKIQRKEE